MPGIILLIMVLSKHTMMPELYGIRSNEMGYYLAFALVIIPFSLIMDVFVLNTQEVRYPEATRESCNELMQPFGPQCIRGMLCKPRCCRDFDVGRLPSHHRTIAPSHSS